jgi:hypothetical protein
LALLKAIEQLPESERQRIVERGKHEGTPYVVTDRLVDYAGLSEWVQAANHHSKSAAGKGAKPVFETAGAWKVPAAAVPPASAPPAPAAPSVPQAPPPVPQTDASAALNRQFTELFPTAERPVVADSLLQQPQARPSAAAPVRPPQPPQAPAAPPVQSRPEPGEFTRMFQSPAVPPTAPVAAPLPAPQAQVPPQSGKEAGEFTRMFQAPGAPFGPGPATAPPSMPAPAAPAPAASKSGPGDFTRFFETPSPAGPMPHSPAVQQPLTPQAPGRSGPNQVSEFTRTFGKDQLETPPAPAAPPSPKEPGEFTRMFHSPGASAPAAPSPLASPQGAARPTPPAMGGATQGFATPPPPAVPKQSGPGEYTRQFSAPAELTFGQTSGTPSAPLAGSPGPQAFAPPAMGQPAMPNMAQPAAAPRKSKLPLILGIIGIVVVAALIVVFLAMRPK